MLKPGEGADVGLLHHVLGFGIVALDAAGYAEQAAIIALRDGAYGRLVPAPRAPHQVFVIALFVPGSFDWWHWHGWVSSLLTVRCRWAKKVPGGHLPRSAGVKLAGERCRAGRRPHRPPPRSLDQSPC
jgi:hypothetical protein